MSTPTTLFEFYSGMGLPLPPVSSRAVIYQNLGLGSASSYTGTAEQNTALLNLLASKAETPPADPNPQPGAEPDLDDGTGLAIEDGMGWEDAMAVIEQYRAELSSFTVADAMASFTPETIRMILGIGGITSEDISSTQSWLASLPPGATMYDVMVQIMNDAMPSGGGGGDGGSGYVGSVPEPVAWVGDDTSGGSGLDVSSPVYEVDPGGAWRIPGVSLDGFPDADDRAFIAGEAFGALLDGASSALTDIVIDDILEPRLPSGAFNLLMSSYDNISNALSLRSLLKDNLTTLLDDISRGMDAISSNDSSFDPSVFDRHLRNFQSEANEMVVSRLGAGGEMLSNAMGRTRLILQRDSGDGAMQSAPADASGLPMVTASTAKVAYKVQTSDTPFTAPAGVAVSVLGAAAGDHLVGGALADLLVGQGGDDRLAGGGGNDMLLSGGGSDAIDGGGGRDTAVFSGQRAGYSATSARVTDNGSGASTSLANVERIKFADGGIAFDITGNAGMAYRLYQAAFDRRPDEPGLGYQMNALDQGLGIAQVAANFIASPEFAATYGNLDDTQFVTQLYRNVLDRAPDADGLAFHTRNLANGMAKADVLVGFSESPENQAAVIGAIQNGMVFTF